MWHWSATVWEFIPISSIIEYMARTKDLSPLVKELERKKTPRTKMRSFSWSRVCAKISNIGPVTFFKLASNIKLVAYTTLRTGRQNATEVLSIRQIFICHKTFALRNDSHHDKAEILSFLAKLIMHWYLAQDAFRRTFTLCSKIQYWIPDVKMLQKFFPYG